MMYLIINPYNMCRKYLAATHGLCVPTHTHTYTNNNYWETLSLLQKVHLITWHTLLALAPPSYLAWGACRLRRHRHNGSRSGILVFPWARIPLSAFSLERKREMNKNPMHTTLVNPPTLTSSHNTDTEQLDGHHMRLPYCRSTHTA